MLRPAASRCILVPNSMHPVPCTSRLTACILVPNSMHPGVHLVHLLQHLLRTFDPDDALPQDRGMAMGMGMGLGMGLGMGMSTCRERGRARV